MTAINRRSLLGLGAGALALTACTPGGGTNTVPAQSGTAEGPVSGNLKVGWYGGAPVHTAMNKALSAFTSSNPSVTTAGTGVAFGDYWDKLATETAGGTGPDVFRMSMTYFVEYSTRGALLDLTAMVDKSIDTKSLDAGVKSSGLVGGKMYGIGQSSIMPAVFANQKMLDSVGGKLPTDWTWDSFRTWTTDFAKNAGPGKYGTSDLAGNFQMFDVYARQQGVSQFTDDGKLNLTKDVVESWLSLWSDLRQAKAAPPQDVTSASGSFETNVMTKGLAPVTYGWVQQVTFFQPLIKGSTVIIGPMPQKTAGDLSGQFLKALDFWCISAKTQAPAAAAKLVDFLINNDAATKEIGLLLGVPPTKKAREQAAAADPASKAAVDYVEQIGSKVGKAPGPWPRGYGECLSSFTRASESVGFGKASPAAAAQTFINEAKSAIGG
jgi:multiple sugar transport system substrate-binding protein